MDSVLVKVMVDNEKFDLSWDDEDFDDEDNFDDEENKFKINIEEALELAQGCDKDGLPSSVAMISIEQGFEDGTSKTRDNGFINQGVFSFSISGGCAVVQVDFPREGGSEYARIAKILQKWFENRENPEYADCMIMTTIVPRLLKSKLVFVFEGLVYFTGIMLQNTERLIMCFDNEIASAAELDGVNYEEIVRKAENEALREEEELQNEYDNLMEKIKKEEYNPYEENIRDYTDAGSDLGKTDGERSTSIDEDIAQGKKKYGMRFSK